MEEYILNYKFYDIINQETWDATACNFDPTIRTEIISQQEVPLGNVILSTPIPGIWISLDIGFNIEGQEDG